jgi:hypothetical protein
MQETSPISFSGVFSLRDGVSEEQFLPKLYAFFQHFIDIGFATGYRVMRREALDDFGRTLPAFTYRVNSFTETWSRNVQRTNTSNNMASR